MDQTRSRSARRFEEVWGGWQRGWLALALVSLLAACEVQAATPSSPPDGRDRWPRIEPFAEDAEPPSDALLADRAPAYADSAPAYQAAPRAPEEYIEQPLAAPPACPPQAFVGPEPRWRTFCACFLPEGIIPGLNPTPDWRKDRGIGIPLQKGGWRTQPFSISGFAGATNGGPLIKNHVFERPSFYGGANFGWDYDHYWGVEKRLGFGALDLTNAQHRSLQTGWSVTGEYRLMWYPLGDSRWRPFVTAGIGWTNFYFQDDFSHHHLETLFCVPFGGGLKYQINERLALRIDMIDEVNIGGGAVTTFNYVALTAGLEFRYGRKLLDWTSWFKKKRP